MEKKNNDFYVSPKIHIINIEVKSIICVSGDIDPTTEEDWAAAPANPLSVPDDIDIISL